LSFYGWVEFLAIWLFFGGWPLLLAVEINAVKILTSNYRQPFQPAGDESGASFLDRRERDAPLPHPRHRLHPRRDRDARRLGSDERAGKDLFYK